MWRTFNCGVGMVVILAPAALAAALELLTARGTSAWVMGHVEAAGPQGSVTHLR
jgi:phosphoribosylformylglycinamidine cyclo-ligase